MCDKQTIRALTHNVWKKIFEISKELNLKASIYLKRPHMILTFILSAI